MDNNHVSVKCNDCGNNYIIHSSSYKRIVRKGSLLRCSKCLKKWYSSHAKEIYANRSDEDKIIVFQNKSKGQKLRYENETQDDILKRVQKRKSTMENKSDEEKNIILNHMIESQKMRASKETDLQKKQKVDRWKESMNNRSNSQIILTSKKRKLSWNNKSLNDYFNIIFNRSITKRNNPNIKRTNTEEIFIKDLRALGLFPGITYDSYYVNHIQSPEFYELFPKNNPYTKSINCWFHEWDFIIYGKYDNILVDIDGSIHNMNRRKNEKTLTAKKGQYKLSELYKFYDSQRPYQTDGMNTYIIEAYNKLDYETKVLNLQTHKYITYLQFIKYISVIIYPHFSLK
jgi:hypothetical protein